MTSTDKELEVLHEKLQKHLYEQSKNWKSFIFAQKKGFYQGFDRIKIDGCRSTEKRFRDYDIEKVLSKEVQALDIGCNSGFFTLKIAEYVKNIDGVEINPYMVSIANDVKKFLVNSNANFYTTSFEKFSTKKKYNMVFSLANDETIDGNTKFTFVEYISKIHELLENNGMLIFESQAADAYEENRFVPKREQIKKIFTIIEDRVIFSEYPVNVPKRIFLILKKKMLKENKRMD
tara:strand:- start:387 stop:1085 length:699 start_codon:yes stop_codon:yes gene_type:complete